MQRRRGCGGPRQPVSNTSKGRSSGIVRANATVGLLEKVRLRFDGLQLPLPVIFHREHFGSTCAEASRVQLISRPCLSRGVATVATRQPQINLRSAGTTSDPSDSSSYFFWLPITIVCHKTEHPRMYRRSADNGRNVLRHFRTQLETSKLHLNVWHVAIWPYCTCISIWP